MIVLQLLESDRKSQWVPRRVLRCSELFHGRMFTCVLKVELIFIEVLIWIHVRQGSQLALSKVFFGSMWYLSMKSVNACLISSMCLKKCSANSWILDSHCSRSSWSRLFFMIQWLCIRGSPSVSNAAMMLHESMVCSDRAVLSSMIRTLYWLSCVNARINNASRPLSGHGSALRLIPDHRR